MERTYKKIVVSSYAVESDETGNVIKKQCLQKSERRFNSKGLIVEQIDSLEGDYCGNEKETFRYDDEDRLVETVRYVFDVEVADSDRRDYAYEREVREYDDNDNLVALKKYLHDDIELYQAWTVVDGMVLGMREEHYDNGTLTECITATFNYDEKFNEIERVYYRDSYTEFYFYQGEQKSRRIEDGSVLSYVKTSWNEDGTLLSERYFDSDEQLFEEHSYIYSEGDLVSEKIILQDGTQVKEYDDIGDEKLTIQYDNEGMEIWREEYTAMSGTSESETQTFLVTQIEGLSKKLSILEINREFAV